MPKSAAAALNMVSARRGASPTPKPHIKALITVRGWKQREAAVALGMDEQRLSGIICGRLTPTDDEVRRIARLLCVTIHEVLEGAGVPIRRPADRHR